MARFIEVQTICFWRAAHALRHKELDAQSRKSAEYLLQHTATRGATCAIRLRAIDALRRNGMPAPVTFGGGGDAA